LRVTPHFGAARKNYDISQIEIAVAQVEVFDPASASEFVPGVQQAFCFSGRFEVLLSRPPGL
jgi:hypothetical protein